MSGIFYDSYAALISSDYDYARRGAYSTLFFSDIVGDVSYFYSELTIPSNGAPTGSYFIANGFSAGNSGVFSQINKVSKVFFHIYSAYNPNDPSQINTDYTILPVRVGN